MKAIRHSLFWLLVLTVAAQAAPPGRRVIKKPATQQLLWTLAYSDGADDAEKTAVREEEYDLYHDATDALDDSDWEEAVTLFEQVVGLQGRYADDALYWMAYALYKDSRRIRARATLDELREVYTESRWLEDAEILELEMETRWRTPRSDSRSHNRDRNSDRDINSNRDRNSNSDPVLAPEADDDNSLKMIILSSLMHTDPEKAQPILIKLLRKPNSNKVYEQTLFLLAQMDTPEARAAIVDFAGRANNSKLQRTAIEYLGIFGGDENLHLLQEIYESTTDRRIKRQIIEAYMVAGETDLLMEIARTDGDVNMRRRAIEMVGVNGDAERLWELYGNEKSTDARAQILEALMIAGDTEHLLEVARSEEIADLRARAVEYMSINGDGDGLWQLYQLESVVRVRAQIIEALMISGNSEYLVQIAHQEENDDLRRKAIEMAGIMGAVDEIWSLYGAETSVKTRGQILESMMINDETEHLLEVLLTEKNVELRARAIEYAAISGGSDVAETLGAVYRTETNKRNRRKIIEALFIADAPDVLIEIARQEKDRELRRIIIEQLSIMDSPKVREFMLELLDDE